MSGVTWRVGAALTLVTAVMGPLSPRPAPAAGGRVVLADMRFTPPRLEVAPGDVVVWQANDDDHTVTARDGTFDSSARGLMGAGDEFRYRFRTPGSFPYYCRVHQSRGMQGEIVVVDPSAPTSTTAVPTPATAAATAPTTSSTTTTTAPPQTTTTRVLATSSTTSLAMATPPAPTGTPAVPQEPPALNPDARLVGSPAPGSLPEAQAAARRSGDSGPGSGSLAIGAVLLAAVGAAGGGTVLRRRSRRSRRRRRGTGS
jgi:plastocyanin